MNAKTARALRKEVGYKPTDERKYVGQVVQSLGSRPRVNGRTFVNDPNSSRGKYRAAKRALRE